MANYFDTMYGTGNECSAARTSMLPGLRRGTPSSITKSRQQDRNYASCTQCRTPGILIGALALFQKCHSYVTKEKQIWQLKKKYRWKCQMSKTNVTACKWPKLLPAAREGLMLSFGFQDFLIFSSIYKCCQFVHYSNISSVKWSMD